MEGKTREISIKVLLHIFIKRLWVIALVMILCLCGTFTYYKITYKEKYNSTTTLYLLAETGTESKPNISTDFRLALDLINDCKFIIYSDKVLDEVSENLKTGEHPMNISTVAIRKAIKVDTLDDLRFMNLSAIWDTPEEAKIIVDEVAKVAVEKANETMRNDTMSTKGVVKVYAEGKVSNRPCNLPKLSTYILVAIIAMILTYIIFIIVYIVDDRVNSAEDIKETFNLSILGQIPDFEESTRKNKKYSKYYNYYTKSAEINSDSVEKITVEEENKK